MSLGITEEIIARQPPEAQAIIRLLLARIAELEARLERLERGQKTPQNSSLPPSSQHPHARPQSQRRKSKKKRGGQPEHEKHERRPIPTGDGDDVQSLKPAECRRCGVKLSGSDREPLRHQVWESPTKEGKSKAWLWTLAAPKFTVFAMRRTREATVLDELLTDQFSGVVACDRAKMYWRLGRLQWRRAHLIRDFQAMIDRGNAQTKRLGYDLRRAAKSLFRHWSDYRGGAIGGAAVQRRLAPVRREVARYLHRGMTRGNRQMQGMCRELYEHRHWLWTFVRCRGVEPTNNASERALRHAAIGRKLSFGVQSAGGSRFVETMLTVIETCRQQGRPLLSFLTVAVQSHLAHHPAPSLLPGA